jgi:hypothetical protein
MSWWCISEEHYGEVINPGDEYFIGDRRYELDPGLVLTKKTRRLQPYYLQRMQDLLRDVTRLLDGERIVYRLSGGTLLGFVRHKSFIPWDDDLDLHVDIGFRKYLFGDEFANKAHEFDLECIFLPGSGPHQATKEGAACRLRRRGDITPVCDIFFTYTRNGVVRKIDSWRESDRFSFSAVEQWDANDMFPVVERQIDGLNLKLPTNPEKILIQQYGPKCLTECVSRSTLISHNTPFKVTNFFWKKK